jgi:hypothetical protein
MRWTGMSEGDRCFCTETASSGACDENLTESAAQYDPDLACCLIPTCFANNEVLEFFRDLLPITFSVELRHCSRDFFL